MSKTKVAKKTMKDPELNKMFNQMLGAETPDPNIAAPKYDKIMKCTDETLEILEKLSKRSKSVPQSFEEGFNEIKIYVDNSRKKLKEYVLEPTDSVYTGKDLEEVNSNPELMATFLNSMNCKYNITDLIKTYKSLKECVVVQEMVMICRNLKNLLHEERERTKTKKYNLDDGNDLSSDFILNSDAYNISVFNFAPKFELKSLFLDDDVPNKFKQYTLRALHLIWKKCNNVLKAITDPDIDISKFSEILVNNIGEIKSHIPGCDDAFNKIKESVGLLENNFNGYYYDFVQAGDPTIIIEHFVGDVAKSSKTNPKVTRQFSKIVQFYQQNMQGKVKDAKVNKLFSMVTENLDVLRDKERSVKKDEKEDSDNKETKETKDDKEETEDEKKPKPKKTKEEIGKSFIPEPSKDSSKSKSKKSSKKSKKTKRSDNVQ